MHPLRRSLSAGTTRRLSDRPGNAPRPLVYTFNAEQTQHVESKPHSRDAKQARVEALLFLADEPLSLKRIAQVAMLQNTDEAASIMNTLQQYYDHDESSFQICELAGGFQLLTRPHYHVWLVRFRRTGFDIRITPSALETLTTIAYKQPITRADLDAIRGVNTSEILRILTEKGLIRIVGRDRSLGRPQLYGTTKKFLQTFGLNTLQDLPPIEV